MCRNSNLCVVSLVVWLSAFGGPPNSHAQTLAFPGAQGFGRFATGGRGGTVYHVTNLNDSGAGSFRDAVSVSGRTVVFDISGVIAYTGSRYNVAPNVTIAGQTAPGDGVVLYGDGIGYNGSHNTITRFIRYRMGINGTSGKDAASIDSGHDMIFDHITVSWGRDETFSISGSNPSNITIQSSIISQGLQGHSAGGLVQTDGGVSILRSLYIDNDTRNPKVKGVNEYVNNVVCNWETIGYNMGGDSAGESFVNVFNNYFIRGQAGSSSAISGGNTDFHIYATNNWYDGNRDGVLNGSDLAFASYGPMDLKTTPFAYPISYASAHSPLTALKLAISDAGPAFRRDSVDERMIQELISWGTQGGTITSELLAPMNGPGPIRNGTPYPDTDQDGMPDFWENGTGSNPAVANNNAASPSGSGYTRLEDYLNWLAEPHGIALQHTNVMVDLRQFTRGWVIVNHAPFWSVSNPTNGTVVLTNGYLARFTPTTGLHSNANFAFTVNDADGSPVTRTMNLFFTPSAQSYKAVWHGDDLANNWNTLGDFNWHDGISLLYQFHSGEPVTFDDTGSTNPAVNLVGALTPASATVDATKHYVLGGSGSLAGTMTLNKTNTGMLTINTTNTFTGATIVSNGTLLVHGALNASAVTVRNSGTIGGNGQLGNDLTIQTGGTLAPGNGIGGAGTLTISNSLTLANNVTHRFDISDDPSGTLKTNDLVQVFGTLSVTGTNYIRVNLLDGPLADGVYPLFKYTTLSGSLTNFVLINANGVLTNPPGMIAIHVDNVRTPASLKWVGNGVNNNWDTGTTTNWLNGATNDVFYFFDSPRFDDSGSSSPAINLIGSLTPQSTTFDATKNYTVGGSGSISGYGPLIKTNSGTLTLTAISDYSGPTVLGGGVLSIATIANAGVASPIGAADNTGDNLEFFGGTLRYTGSSAATDRNTGLMTSGAFEVSSSGTTLSHSGLLSGAGRLVKLGAGTLTLSGNNTFSGGTVISNGTLALDGPAGGGTTTANNYSLGSGSVTLHGGTLKLFGYNLSTSPSYGSFSRPIIVPAGATGTLLTPPRYAMSSTLQGGGTLNLEVDYVRGAMSGNWSAFTGLINISGHVANSEFRVANGYGYAEATLFLNDNVVITRNGGAITVEIGALGGTSGSRIGPGNSTSSGSSYRVGWRNTDATFAGQILADGVNTITKVGLGNWTLSGSNTFTGGLVIDTGAVTLNTANAAAAGVITLNGGTLVLNGPALTTYPNSAIVFGAASTIVSSGGGNNTLSGAWSGGAGVTASVSITNGFFSVTGSLVNLLGTLSLGTSSGNFRFNVATGSTNNAGNTSFDTGTGTATLMDRNGAVIHLGSLAGGAGTKLAGANSVNAPCTYIIGAKHLSTTFGGVIQNGSQAAAPATIIQKVGTGTLTLTGANTYTGGTTVSGGTLRVNNSNGSGTGTGVVTVKTGATLAGTGSLAGVTTFESGATLSPGSSVGTLTFTNLLNLNAGTLLAFELGTSSDLIVVGGGLQFAGSLNISNAGGFGAGSYLLFSYDTNKLFQLGTFSFGTRPAGYYYTLSTNTPGQVRLLVQPATPPGFSGVVAEENSLILSGQGGPPGGTFVVLASTNAVTPTSNWTRLRTNQFDANGNFSVILPLEAGTPQQFFRLLLP